MDTNLTTRTFMMILSKNTHNPYIGKTGYIYLFERPSEAEAFCKEIPDTESAPSKNYTEVQLKALYELGVVGIKYKTNKSDKETTVDFKPEDIKPGYHNTECNYNIQRLKHTKQKKYLRKLKDCIFLIPINIRQRKPAEYPWIEYGAVQIKSNEKYMLLFTTIQEFNKWNEEVGNKWMPLEIVIPKLKTIRKKKPVMINPLSDKLILTNSQMIIAENAEDNNKQREDAR